MKIAIILLTYMCFSVVQAISFDLKPGKTECIFEDVHKGLQVSLAYAVSSGSHMDIDATIFDPNGKSLYTATKEGEGKFQFVAEIDGSYRFCFSNSMSVMSHKVVRVAIETGELPELATILRKDGLDKVETSIISISHLVRMVTFHQANYRQLYERHLTTVEGTNNRVRIWSLLECFSVLLVGVLQILFIKRTFPVQNRGLTAARMV